jgi:uncharacterized protein YcfL
MKHVFFVIFIPLIFISCSKNLYVTYQYDSKNTGKVILMPNTPTEKTSVTLNDNLIVNKKYVKSVTIDNVPVGEVNIKYVSSNYWYKDKLDENIKLDLKENQRATKLIEVPPYSAGYWIYISSIPIISLLLTLL